MLQGSSSGGVLRKTPSWTGAVIVAGVVAVVGTGYGIWRSQSIQPTTHQISTQATKIATVTALGRLEPQGTVIQLSAPTTANGNRVEQLLVQAGDRVQKGQVIAILDSRDRLQAAYEQAQQDVKVAQARLAITQAGAKPGEIAAQQVEIERLEAQGQGDVNTQVATIARLTAELQNAETEFNRYQALASEGAISASDLDSRRLAFDTARRRVQEAEAILARIQSTTPAQLNQAKANLERVSEVRSVDVAANQAEVERSIAAMKQAKANLDQAYVKAPITGEILEIHTYAGEVVSSPGIADIGQTQQMNAIAQVYESDIRNVKLGQRARISSDSLPGELRGTVKRIDSQVRRQTVVNTDPSTNVDSRVVEVHVALDATSSKHAAKFTNLQVTVEIEL